MDYDISIISVDRSADKQNFCYAFIIRTANNVEYQQHKRQASKQRKDDQASTELPALRKKLKVALRTTKTSASDIKKLREMIGKRERMVAQAEQSDE